MICKNLSTNVKYNYQMPNPDKVKLWNPTTRPFYISYDEWCKDYLIIDKWLTL